jgi:hypothetical protein
MRDGFDVDLICKDCLNSPHCEPYVEYERTDTMEGISKETFLKMDTDSKLAVLFDYVHDIHESAPKRVRDRDVKCARQVADCMKKFGKYDQECESVKKSLKIRGFINTGASFVGGFIGGWSAVWAAFRFSIFGS